MTISQDTTKSRLFWPLFQEAKAMHIILEDHVKRGYAVHPLSWTAKIGSLLDTT